MSLSDSQIEELCKRMDIPLGDVLFKDEMNDIEFNKAYFVNIQDSTDEDGQANQGTHWTLLQCRKYPNGSVENIYFDPYGKGPPEEVKKLVLKYTNKALPYTKKDIQSLMNNACGFYCCAMAHFINASRYRTGSLYDDVETFLDMFDDLNTSIDFKKNEYILKHFFRSEAPELRKEIDVDTIVNDDSGGIDVFKQPINLKIKKNGGWEEI